jgi:hypothetical protein
MTFQASSSLMVAGTRGTIPVPGLPFLMTHMSSPSFRFLWNLQLVKSRGPGFKTAPAGPCPSPFAPWQFTQVPFPSNKALPSATISGEAASALSYKGDLSFLASARLSAGTRAGIGSFSGPARYQALSSKTSCKPPGLN